MSKEQVVVGIVNIGGNVGGGLLALPYVAGLLEEYVRTYAVESGRYHFVKPIYKLEDPVATAERLRGCDVVGISIYAWNSIHSLSVARELKLNNPDVLVVLGGAEVPNSETGLFLEENSAIDAAVHGDGEKSFLDILEKFPSRVYRGIPGVSYIDRDTGFVVQGVPQRCDDLASLVSPFVSGYMDKIVDSEPSSRFVTILETNRGCPYSCTYCQWGGSDVSKVYKFPLDRVFSEIDWISRNPSVETILSCDANFGIFPRDIEIAEYIAEKKRATGSPRRFFISGNKNNGKVYKQCVDILMDAGLVSSAPLPFQSLHNKSLAAVNRKNKSFDYMLDMYMKSGEASMATSSDIIMPLPEETYESFTEGYTSLLMNLRNGSTNVYPLVVLVNSELALPEERERYALQTVDTPPSWPFVLKADKKDIYAKYKTVISTSTMSRYDWVRSNVFQHITECLVVCKVLDIPIKLLRATKGISYKDVVEKLISEADYYPTLRWMVDAVETIANAIADGGEWYPVDELTGRSWTISRYLLVMLVGTDKLDSLYSEAISVLVKYYAVTEGDEIALKDAVLCNQLLLTQPEQYEDVTVSLSSNVMQVVNGFVRYSETPLEFHACNISVHRSNEVWGDLSEWSTKVVMYRNRASAYQHEYSVLNSGCVESIAGVAT